MNQIHKYPRTRHIEGSRLAPGDEDLDATPFSRIADRHVVVEEKMDGANCAVSFTRDGELRLQSRGHYLTGGGREKHFALFKSWAAAHQTSLWAALRSRHVMYGEWLFAKHTVFYDRLPHYFLEFDVLDTEAGEFLDTHRRAELLQDAPVAPVKVLLEGKLRRLKELKELVGPSHFISDCHRERLAEHCRQNGLNIERALRETDRSNLMEGLYIKVEESGAVKERYKYVRADFLQTVVKAEGHWLDRPIIPNQLDDHADIFHTQV